LIERHGLTGDPAAGIHVPSIDDPVAQLGKKLFLGIANSKALSAL
jgi:hypothetical protein